MRERRREVKVADDRRGTILSYISSRPIGPNSGSLICYLFYWGGSKKSGLGLLGFSVVTMYLLCITCRVLRCSLGASLQSNVVALRTGVGGRIMLGSVYMLFFRMEWCMLKYVVILDYVFLSSA